MDKRKIKTNKVNILGQNFKIYSTTHLLPIYLLSFKIKVI